MKKFSVIVFSLLVLIGLSKSAQAFTTNDLISQITSLRAELGQLKGSMQGQVLGVSANGTLSSDYKDSTSTTGTPAMPVPPPVMSTMPSVGSTMNPPAAPSLVGNPGYWILGPENNCILVQIRPQKSVPCTQQSEAFSQTEAGRADSGGYWILNEANECVRVKIRPGRWIGCASTTNNRSAVGSTGNPGTKSDLSFGMKKDLDVLNLQIDLKNRGFLSGTADGNFGQMTKNAVMNFQRLNSLPVTGVADTKTIAAIDAKVKVDVDAYIASIPKQIADLQKQIADLQEILKDPAAYKARVK